MQCNLYTLQSICTDQNIALASEVSFIDLSWSECLSLKARGMFLLCNLYTLQSIYTDQNVALASEVSFIELSWRMNASHHSQWIIFL